MNKIGLVVPWYGDDIPGGAEMEARELANHLHEQGEKIEILTTCVKEFSADWGKNYYKPGEYLSEKGIMVKRFSVRKRDNEAFDAINAKLMQNQQISFEEEEIFLNEMINSPELYKYIRENKKEYAVFLFIPYMFGTTYFGIQECLEKAVMIPCFHDESYAYFEHFREVFPKVAGMVFNAKPEYELAKRLYRIDESNVNSVVMGIGMNTNITSDKDRFRKKYRIDQPFILYAGRKDEGKNVHTLLKYFEEYKKRIDNDLQLILIGGGNISIPNEIKKDVHDLGFVDVQDKYDAYSAAALLCQPSKNESFSLVIMESWLCGRPVLVHGLCDVTRNFVVESNGGLYFDNYLEFEACVNFVLKNEMVAEKMGENGKKYVEKHFEWSVIVEKYNQLINAVAEKNKIS